MKKIEELKKREIKKFDNITGVALYSYEELCKLIDQAVSIATKQAVERERKNIIDILYFVLDELTAIDQALRLEPATIYHPFKLRKAENVAVRATLEKFKIPFTEDDLKPEGDKQKQAMINFLKEHLSTPQPEETESESLNCYDIHEMQKMAGKRKPIGFNPAKSSLIKFSPQPEVCKWVEDDDGIYHTDCGHECYFNDGPIPKSNKYCTYCSKPIELVSTPQQEEAPDENN